jgi:hypothetical protein
VAKVHHAGSFITPGCGLKLKSVYALNMNLETTDQPSNLIYAERPFFNSRSKLVMVNKYLIIIELHPMR